MSQRVLIPIQVLAPSSHLVAALFRLSEDLTGFFMYLLNVRSVWVQLLVSQSCPVSSRSLFDRVIHLSLSVKKIKFFFKRYLEYEKKHGTPESIQAVKEKAMEFVEAKGADSAK